MAEREWREASDMRSPKAAVLLVLGCAAGLRFWSLGHGIPTAVGADEAALMTIVVRMMNSGDFNPHFFGHPGLYIYVQLVVACARFVVGAMGGLWHELGQVTATDFYIWGRAVTAILGTATAMLVFQIGMRWGSRHALLAAGLMAVMPMHVRESHSAFTAVPATFFVTLAFLLSLRANERATAGPFLWAGAAVGLAAATTYSGATAFILPAVSAWMTAGARPSRLRCLLAAIAGSVAAFLLAAPYTVLDLPGFLNGFGGLALSYGPTPRTAHTGWLSYLQELQKGFGWPATILAAGGLVLAGVRAASGPGRVRWTLLLAFPPVFVYAIVTKGLILGGSVLPVVPFVCILVAATVVSGVSLLRRFDIARAPRTALIAGLTIAVLLPPALASVRFNRSLSGASAER